MNENEEAHAIQLVACAIIVPMVLATIYWIVTILS